MDISILLEIDHEVVVILVHYFFIIDFEEMFKKGLLCQQVADKAFVIFLDVLELLLALVFFFLVELRIVAISDLFNHIFEITTLITFTVILLDLVMFFIELLYFSDQLDHTPHQKYQIFHQSLKILVKQLPDLIITSFPADIFFLMFVVIRRFFHIDIFD